MRVPRLVLSLFAALSAFWLGSCQSVTPMSRIEQNPVMFRVLSPEHQLLVQQGRICEGMSKDAVFLAWGNPDTPPVTGQQGGKSYEKWVYVVYYPVTMDTVTIGTGCWHHGPWHCGSGVGTTTTMVPREAAWVMFQDNVVTAWEKRN